MDPVVVILLVFVALAAGVALGWLVGRGRAGALAEERGNAAELLRMTLDEVTKERDSSLQDIAALKAATAEREQAHIEQLKRIQEAEAQFKITFEQLAAKALSEAQSQFLKRADDKFGEAGRQNEANIKSLLEPVGVRLKAYEEQVAKVEKERTEAYGNISGLVETMRAGQQTLVSETSRLVHSLRGNPKTPGDWGQHHFQNLIEISGLTQHIDYQREKSFATEEGNKRPDFVINLPDGGRLVVDVKCSLDSYLSASNEPDPKTRDAFLAAHAKAVRNHADNLAKKSYFEDVAGSPDFVVMYIPGDHYFTAAMEAEPELWKRAADRRVIIASPGTFVPLAHSLATMWRSFRLSEDAQKIAVLGKEMYDRLAKVAEDLRKVGVGLNSAVNNFNSFSNSFNGRLMVTGRKFRDLNVDTAARELEAVPSIDVVATAASDPQLPRPDSPSGAE